MLPLNNIAIKCFVPTSSCHKHKQFKSFFVRYDIILWYPDFKRCKNSFSYKKSPIVTKLFCQMFHATMYVIMISSFCSTNNIVCGPCQSHWKIICFGGHNAHEIQKRKFPLFVIKFWDDEILLCRIYHVCSL